VFCPLQFAAQHRPRRLRDCRHLAAIRAEGYDRLLDATLADPRGACTEPPPNATSKPRLLTLTRAQRTPSYQSHADGGARLPAGMEQLQEMGMIETLRPKLVVNWDLASPPRAGTPRGGQSPRGGGTPRVLSVPSQPSLPAAGYQACGRLDSPRGVSALSISSVGAPSPFDRRR